MTEKALNILLVEDDKVDVMNVKRAFDKNRIANPLFVARQRHRRADDAALGRRSPASAASSCSTSTCRG